MSNIDVSIILENELGIIFANREYSLDGWGEADNYYQESENSFIFLECENTQKHPNTNVLKYWPFLESNPLIRVILIQYFFPKNKAPKNRLALCSFLARKTESFYPQRFQYISLNGEADSIVAILKARNKGLLDDVLTIKQRSK